MTGFIVAWRKPANPLGWLLLGAALEPEHVSVWLDRARR